MWAGKIPASILLDMFGIPKQFDLLELICVILQENDRFSSKMKLKECDTTYKLCDFDAKSVISAQKV
jgi:hypothetical protein